MLHEDKKVFRASYPHDIGVSRPNVTKHPVRACVRFVAMIFVLVLTLLARSIAWYSVLEGTSEHVAHERREIRGKKTDL